MNRKLINGLLLLTVATGGVGTFTSCKDNEEGYEIKKDQAKLFDILDEKIKNGDENLAVVRDKLNALLDAGLLTEENQKYLEQLIQNSSTNLKEYVDDMVMNLITNVQIEEVYNPAFGTINLPIGIKNGLLCNYYYQSDHAVKFPRVDDTNIVYGDKDAQLALENAIKAGLAPEGAIEVNTAVQPIDRLGEIYVTINPASIPEKALEGLTITMVKTNGEQVLGTLKAVKEDEHVKNFGYTRANDNGFYKFEVKVEAADVPSINLNLDDQLKSAAKDFVKSPSKSDLLGLAEAIYKQFNNRIPALGLRFDATIDQSFTYNGAPWSKVPGGLVLPNVTVDENGNYILNGNTPSNSEGGSTDVTIGEGQTALRTIISPYDIAAVTYHPLSYSFDPEGYVPDRRLPQIGHIQEYVNRALDKFNFQLNLKEWNAKDYQIDFSKVNFTIDPTSITIKLEGTPVYDAKGYENGQGIAGATPIGVLGKEANITLGYNGETATIPGKNETALNDLVNSIASAVNGGVNPDGSINPGFKGDIETQVNDMLTKMVNDINTELKGINTQITDKIQSVKDEINNELSGRLGDGINRLIDLYNKIAQKVNTILDDPNAYMQVYAAYRDGNGDLHHFSTVKADPSVFTPGTGDAITMFLTSYNGELLAPAYKKYVAVLDKDGKSVAAANAAPYLNKVLKGRQQKTYIPVNALTPGEVYQVVYTALDYRGNVSARSFYIKVAK